jgi:hypothetical protein
MPMIVISRCLKDVLRTENLCQEVVGNNAKDDKNAEPRSNRAVKK